MRNSALTVALALVGLLLAGCDRSAKEPPPGPPPTPDLYEVSGTVTNEAGDPVPGVTITFSGPTESVTTNASGDWSQSGLTGSVTITPTLKDHTFTPETITVTEARSDANFTATKTNGETPSPDPTPGAYEVSGTVTNEAGDPVPGVTITFSGPTESVTTNASGDWSQSDLTGSVTITPTLKDHTFTPETITVTEARSDANFTATKTNGETPPPGTIRPTVTLEPAGDQVLAVTDTLELRAQPVGFVEAPEFAWSDGSDDADRFNDSSGESVVWTAPKRAGVYTIRVTATTANQRAEASVRVEVTSPCSEVASAAECYLIFDLADLQAMENDLSGHYLVMNDINAANTALDPDGKGFRPIGSENEPFTGVLDGQGKTIEELHMRDAERNGVGLIGWMSDSGKVMNVTLDNATVEGKDRVGALVGQNNGGTIEKSGSRRGAVSFAGSPAGFAVGGLIGRSWGGNVTGSFTTSGSVSGGNRVGGLIGHAANGATITGSTSSANVTGAGTVGGLVGELGAEGIITTSKALGKVSATAPIVGGLVGKSAGSISQSFSTNSGTVASSSTLGVVGGLVGETTSDATIAGSYSHSDVDGANSVGGLVGKNSGAIRTSYSVGKVTSAGSSVGGLIGAPSGPQDTRSSYWNTATSGQATSAGGEGRTTTQMKDQANYTGWNFTSAWTMNQTDGYPDIQNNRRLATVRP